MSFLEDKFTITKDDSYVAQFLQHPIFAPHNLNQKLSHIRFKN